ncbi:MULTISPECIES: glutathione synthase [Tenacibaculum]|uniref:glutathione synthase n=1 Tax=Tenacibaculum TaxID=104267 RepID=UPI001F0AC11C|nr:MULTISPECIES: glutathione synthase [Tenacibaculum]MCH3882635.1 glutathione synthase [Tenacibaculum aquimarinum]MDO6600329.1 glutathione synthase [Tenacibaculum sp. 1_MG-2023]
MNVCFLMYPWESIKAPENDTSLTLIHECVKRGHGVAICSPSNLTIRNSVTSAFCTILKRAEKVPANLKTFHKKTELREEMLPLAGFDIIFMRAEPPLDPIMLNFLDSVKDDVFIINSVQGMRVANNKLYTAVFEDPNNEIIPVTHVSKNKDYLVKMIEESNSDKMILKPLNGFGGSGVILIEKSAMGNINSLLDFYINKGDGNSDYVILQEYIEGADKGDVRILLLNGLPIGAMKRVPGDKDHRSNVSAGGTIEKHKLTAQEKLLCKKIGPKLVKDGLYFVGIDVIGGKLVEVNVMSPGGITYMNRVYKTKVQEKVVDFMESKYLERNAAFIRKSDLKRQVDEA